MGTEESIIRNLRKVLQNHGFAVNKEELDNHPFRNYASSSK
jgi:hypothetical protein